MSLQRVRWILLAGAALLLAVLAAFVIYGHHRALKAYQEIVARSGVSLTHDSNGVTWSQSVKNRKLYTIRAKTESSLGDGKYALHDAELLLYTRSEEHPDRIYGSQMEYDQNDGILRANGEVFMEIQPPQVLSAGRPPANVSAGTSTASSYKDSSGQIIHVRTSGLVYVRKLGIASTRQKVYFRFGGIQCSAIGADFSSDQSTLRLLADVQMDGFAHNQPLHVVATHAEMDRNSNIVEIAEPVATSEGRVAKAAVAVLHLRKDGSIERVDGLNGIQANAGTQQITASHVEATFTPDSILRTARLQENVLFTDTDPKLSMHGSADTVDDVFDSDGALTTMTATGSAKMSLLDRRMGTRGLARSMEGNQIVAHFVRGQRKSSSILQQVHATGSARIDSEVATEQNGEAHSGSARDTELRKVQVAANDLRVAFVADEGKPQPHTLDGTGDTLLQQDAPMDAQQISTGDTLQMAFAPVSEGGQLSITSAVQTGHVEVHDRAATDMKTHQPGALSSGSADRETYDGLSQLLTLAGNAHVYGESASMVAPKIVLNQRTQDAYASGGVQTAFEKSQQRGPQAKETPAAVTHILSSSARFLHEKQSALFLGTDAQPAFMWQESSQVKAATLFFDRARRTLIASPERPGERIHVVLASTPPRQKAGSQAMPATAVDITSGEMTYDDLRSEATFSGGVLMDGTLGQLTGKGAVVFLSPRSGGSAAQSSPARDGSTNAHAEPNPLGSSVERIVVEGDVRLKQPGRTATGEQLLYDAAKQSYILTGTPTAAPHVVDEYQGSVTGKTLIFADGGSTIVVAGDSASKAAGARVRTETTVGHAKGEKQ